MASKNVVFMHMLGDAVKVFRQGLTLFQRRLQVSVPKGSLEWSLQLCSVFSYGAIHLELAALSE